MFAELVAYIDSSHARHVQSEWFAALRQLDLSLEGINLPPPIEDDLLLGGKIDRHGALLEECKFQVGVTKGR